MARVERRRALVLLAAGWGTTASAQTPGPPGTSHASAGEAAAPGGGNIPLLRAEPTPDPARWVTVWVDLDLPELASLPREQRAERAALRANVLAQQDAVMARLRELGATEEARVQQVRNALAVRLPGAAIETARHIPGVRGVRTVRHVRREPPSSRN